MENPIPAAPAAPSQDERLMAALCHGSLILGWAGLVVSVIMWITQKDKSRYVTVQALQALLFQLVRLAVTMVGLGCYMVAIFSTIFTTTASDAPRYGGPPPGFFVPFAFLCVIGLVGMLFFAYAVYAVVMTIQGKEFYYLVIGDWVERFMQPAESRR